MRGDRAIFQHPSSNPKMVVVARVCPVSCLFGFSPRRYPPNSDFPRLSRGSAGRIAGNRSVSRMVSTATVPGACRNRPCLGASGPDLDRSGIGLPAAERPIESARAGNSFKFKPYGITHAPNDNTSSGISSSSAPPRRHRPQRRLSPRECARWHSGPPGPWGFRAHVRARPCARCCRPVQ